MFKRILASFILLLSVLYLPIWLSIILALAEIIYFTIFLEAVFIMLLSDLIFGLHQSVNSYPLFITFIIMAIVLVIVEIIKKKLKFYA